MKRLGLGWCAVAGLLSACGGAARTTLEQPVGSVHDEVRTVEYGKQARLEKIHADDLPGPTRRPQQRPRYRLCNLPDTVHEAPHFAANSAVLGQRGERILNQVANCMVRGVLADESVVVVGYADDRGSPRYNTALALERARRVAGYLVRRGVPPGRVHTVSRGEHFATGSGPESRRLDRRVEVWLVDQQTTQQTKETR